MANGNINLLAPNISDDDRLWIARCDFEGLRSFLSDPIGWVADLSRDPSGNPRYVLTSNYVVEFRPKIPTPETSSAVVIEGISNTPFVTVRISAGAPTPPPDYPQWDAWGDEDIAIKGVAAEGLIYGHLQIIAASDPAPVRNEKLFQALVNLSCDLSLMNRLLSRQTRSVVWVQPIPAPESGTEGGTEESLPSPITFAPLTSNADGVTIVLEGDENGQLEGCYMFVGTQSTTGAPVVIGTVGVKTYYPETGP